MKPFPTKRPLKFVFSFPAMRYRILLLVVLGWLLPATTAWAKSKIHPKILFTWLAIGSTALVVALWIMIWNRRKRD